MNKIDIKIVFVCFLLIAGIELKAQVLKEVQSAFNVYHQSAFQEKMFVHTDKEQYVTGELLWFRVYNVDASSNLPVDLSKVAYIELLDQANQPIIQTKIVLKKGNGNGSVYLPLSATNGNYKLRAYTLWMNNFGASHYFEKKITLINPLIEPEKTKKALGLPEFQFFPEGGELVEGVSNSIGFKVADAEGKGVAIKGVVINQKNDTVARFQTHKFGMGHFKFTPLVNQTYKVISTTNEKEIIITTLPSAKKQGYTLFLEDKAEDALSLTVASNLTVGAVSLFIYQGNKMSIAQSTNLNGGQAVFQINKSKLADGLSHLTLFNENGQAVAERLYFKRPNKSLKLSASLGLSSYKLREKVDINLQAYDEKFQPSVADVSISVRRLDSLQGMDESDIVSYFWLSSEVKGEIESPSYYFNNPSPEKDKALDYLLLTQGWRRMAWDVVLSKKSPLKFLPEFNGHLITGKVSGKNISKGSQVYLSIPNSYQQFYSALSDSAGNFVFNTIDFYGPNEIILQTNSNVDTTSKITIQSPFSEKYTSFSYTNFNLKQNLLNTLNQHSFGMQVQNIYVADQLKKIKDLKLDTLRFYGKPFKSYNLDDYTRFTLMEDVLREYVRETYITKSSKQFVINVLGESGLLVGEPLAMVDGVPYFNINRVMEINPKRIKRLEVVRNDYYYRSGSYAGILNFISYKPTIATLEINPNAVVLDYEGMQLQREFYSPSYETAEKKKSHLPDFRNLLFWSPSTLIDEKGNAKLDFYTSDQPGMYIGVINGLSATGIPGTGTFSFEVKK